MIVLARLLARLVAIVLMALIAVVGVAAALFCIRGGHSTLSLDGLASDLHLPQVRQDVNFFLTRTTAHGSVAIVAALAGAGAVLIGLLLITGCWITPRPWRVVLRQDEGGTVGARRRPLTRLATDVTQRDPQIFRAHARVRPRRRRDGGRLIVRARAAVTGDRRTADGAAHAAITPLVGAAPIRVKVRARRATRRQRRQAREDQA